MNSDSLKDKLTQHFSPSHLNVVDNSYQHAGHNEEAKKGGTHFSVEMVSEKFAGLSLIKRHRLVNDLFKEAFNTTPLHALELRLLSPEEEL